MNDSCGLRTRRVSIISQSTSFIALIGIIGFVFALAQPAFAQFTVNTISRRTRAAANSPTGMDETVTTAGPYNNSFVQHDSHNGVGSLLVADATGSQTSDTESTGFSGTGLGLASASKTTTTQNNDFSIAGGLSFYNLTFSVTQVTPFTLSGTLGAAGTGSSSISIAGQFSGGFDSFTASDNTVASQPFTYSNTLVPGQNYFLDVTASANAQVQNLNTGPSSQGGQGTFSFTLGAVPEPGSLAMLASTTAPLLLLRRRKRHHS